MDPPELAPTQEVQTDADLMSSPSRYTGPPQPKFCFSKQSHLEYNIHPTPSIVKGRNRCLFGGESPSVNQPPGTVYPLMDVTHPHIQDLNQNYGLFFSNPHFQIFCLYFQFITLFENDSFTKPYFTYILPMIQALNKIFQVYIHISHMHIYIYSVTKILR